MPDRPPLLQKWLESGLKHCISNFFVSQNHSQPPIKKIFYCTLPFKNWHKFIILHHSFLQAQKTSQPNCARAINLQFAYNFVYFFKNTPRYRSHPGLENDPTAHHLTKAMIQLIRCCYKIKSASMHLRYKISKHHQNTFVLKFVPEVVQKSVYWRTFIAYTKKKLQTAIIWIIKCCI